MNTSTALVTGASVGLGAEFARQLAAAGTNLVLVARNESQLEELAGRLRGAYGVEIEVLPADLTNLTHCAVVERRLADPDRPVDVLVNNAGVGMRKRFTLGSVDDEDRMLALNVRAVMRLSHAVLPGMKDRGRGAVLNVSSVAGFGPVASGSTYPATKAWVTNFSESLFSAMRPHGVTVMALCPGFVHTEFHARAGLPIGQPGNRWWLSAESVVAAALRDLRRGKAVSVPTLRYHFVVWLMRHLPKALLRSAVVRNTRDRVGKSNRAD